MMDTYVILRYVTNCWKSLSDPHYVLDVTGWDILHWFVGRRILWLIIMLMTCNFWRAPKFNMNFFFSKSKLQIWTHDKVIDEIPSLIQRSLAQNTNAGGESVKSVLSFLSLWNRWLSWPKINMVDKLWKLHSPRSEESNYEHRKITMYCLGLVLYSIASTKEQAAFARRWIHCGISKKSNQSASEMCASWAVKIFTENEPY